MPIFPDYYSKFFCIAERCKHNCCIGWEIDIDADTLTFYQTVKGELGDRLKQNISLDETPHFRLGESERCPFLNEQNLCDLILELGEDHLCQICTDHPRFRNELPGRLEIGVGLCCEAAGALILGKKEPTHLVLPSEELPYDEIISVRDEVIAVLQNRTQPMHARIERMQELCDSFYEGDWGQWAEFLLSLERLESSWTDLLNLLKKEWNSANFDGFDRHMKNRQTEYEQLAVYFVYRHLANAFDGVDLSARAAFAALAYRVIYTLGAILWTQNGDFTFDDQVELARHFSAEIEYSDDNLNALFDALVS